MLTLSPDTHVCEIGRTAVFLDVRGDRYIRLTQMQSDWLSQITDPALPPEAGGDASRFGARLVDLGLLQAVDTTVKPFAPLRRPAPHSSVYDLEPRHAASGSDIRHMILALMACWYVVRRRKLGSAIDAARRWSGALPEDSPPAPQEAMAKAQAFHALSPYFFTSRDKCLFRSLALARFLAFSGVRCDWVFGIRLSPFEAHCWLEHDGIALNEHTDKTQEFCPVLCV